jgi:hypothetical protein
MWYQYNKNWTQEQGTTRSVSLTSDPPRQLQVTRKKGHPPCVNRTQVGIFHETNKVSLGSLLLLERGQPASDKEGWQVEHMTSRHRKTRKWSVPKPGSPKTGSACHSLSCPALSRAPAERKEPFGSGALSTAGTSEFQPRRHHQAGSDASVVPL